MQTYSLATIGLLVGMLFVGTYAWQGPQDTTVRVALIDNAKPALVANASPSALNNRVTASPLISSAPARSNETDLSAVQLDTTAESGPQNVVLNGTNFADLSSAIQRELGELDALQVSETASAALDDTAVADLNLDASPEADVEISNPLEPTLPTEYTGLEWSFELTPETTISDLTFTDQVDDDLNPLNPSRLFEEGFYAIYATFEYDGMADGMSWSWVWRRDGEVINGGHEIWNYGNDGPGYVFLNPQEGFSPGQYVVEVWVNEELFSQANMFVTTDTAANN
ncbi:MAG: hypothetical protein KDD89_00050 [Anaerolineales bacterium]|nr:hypothetical protein [Anaerolineales bacterium]